MARQLEKGRVVAADKGRAAAAAAPPPPEPAKKRRPFKLILMAVVLLLVIGAGGAWYYFMRGGAPTGTAKAAPPAPFFVDIKPFVITMKAADGSSHYVQLSLSLQVPGAEAINAADAVMPEILDMVRQAVLAFKTDQLQTPQGVNQLRAALVGGANRVLLQSFGAAKVAEMGGKNGVVVSAIYFSNLVIQ